MDNREKDLYRLEHMLESARKIEKIVVSSGSFETFVVKWIEQDAMVRNFEIIGEASNHISETIKKEYPEVEWFKVKGLRNLIGT